MSGYRETWGEQPYLLAVIVDFYLFLCFCRALLAAAFSYFWIAINSKREKEREMWNSFLLIRIEVSFASVWGWVAWNSHGSIFMLQYVLTLIIVVVVRVGLI